jgi:sugar/nucleoside kinase (ribokinase family)
MDTCDICIAGEINLDLILYGLPAAMTLERELLANGFTATLGGSSAIVAHNAASLGAKVSFFTLVGCDHFGRIALNHLETAGVDVSGAKRHEALQTGVTVLLPHGTDRHILTYPGTMEIMRTDDLDFARLSRARHFHLSSLYLQKGMHAGLPSLCKRLKSAGLSISMDTNDDPADQWGEPLHELLQYVDCFLPNESEVCRMTHCDDLEGALEALSPTIPLVVVKRGSFGVRIREGKKVFDVAPIPVSTVDTIGAGDSFDAGFLLAYLAGKDARTCAQAGNIAGALSTQGAGGTEAFRDKGLRESFLQEHGFYELVNNRKR